MIKLLNFIYFVVIIAMACELNNNKLLSGDTLLIIMFTTIGLTTFLMFYKEKEKENDK